MSHLRPDQFLDLADGTLSESSAPHLELCESCRRQLGDMRRILSAVAEVGVPEPSPLFWDHFTERVKQAVALEGAPRRASGWERWSWARVVIPLSAAALVALIVAATLGTRPNVQSLPPASQEGSANLEASLPEPADAADDPSLSLIADLAAALDWNDWNAWNAWNAWDAATHMEWTTDAGGADQAVSDFTSEELLELQRLLKEELAQAGA